MPATVRPAVNTVYDRKPIPVRQFDWCATFEGYEPGDPMGWGATEAQAVLDLHLEVEILED